MNRRQKYPGNLTAYLILIILVVACKSTGPDPNQETVEITNTIAVEEQDETYLADRERMVENQISRRGVEDPTVLAAMESVPRQLFVPEEFVSQAYNDHPLPIGYGQTISQPYIVALMTEALDLKTGDRVLEVGTGSGYQAAVLAELNIEVYSIEIIPELALSAASRLEDLGYSNIQLLTADGYFGWEDQAPFDAIIVTAAPDHLPQPLIQQLAEGGRMIIPIGPIGAVQTLWLFKHNQGELEALNLGGVKFVPLTGDR